MFIVSIIVSRVKFVVVIESKHFYRVIIILVHVHVCYISVLYHNDMQTDLHYKDLCVHRRIIASVAKSTIALIVMKHLKKHVH